MASGSRRAQETNFESIARQLRYRRLAYACIEEGIEDLFLGHHQDDQVETIISRLLKGQKVATGGLRGMKACNRIPECWDILGASVGFEASPISSLLRTSETGASSIQKWNRRGVSSARGRKEAFPHSIQVANCGIKLYRPLLAFSKSRLVATCKSNHVPFVTDRTNLDPRITERNAIRWLLSNNLMPLALRPDKVLRLGAVSAKTAETRMAVARKLMSATHVSSFDIRSSRLTVVLPRNIVDVYQASTIDAAFYVDRLLTIVGPLGQSSNTSFRQLQQMATWMFPELCHSGSHFCDEPLRINPFTARGVLVERQLVSSTVVWHLSRQPFRAGQNMLQTFDTLPFYAKLEDRDWSRWVLWDGRFWIRIRTSKPQAVQDFQVRALHPSDMEELKSRPDQKRFGQILRKAAPGKIRYTLPVIVRGEELRALPTFGLSLSSDTAYTESGVSEKAPDSLHWEVRYTDITEVLRQLNQTATDIKGDLTSIRGRGTHTNKVATTQPGWSSLSLHDREQDVDQALDP